ncbi:MAG: energy transducer TonB, partial [Terracidiphilus sp.]
EFQWPKNEEHGYISLKITIGIDGLIHDPQVITSTSPALTTAVLKSLAQWLYVPYKLNGEPVEAEEELAIIHGPSN